MGRVERSNEGLTRTALFDRGNWMIFRVKSHPVFFFEKKCLLRNRFDSLRGEEKSRLVSYPLIESEKKKIAFEFPFHDFFVFFTGYC